MNGVGFYNDRVVMPTCFLRSLMLSRRHQAEMIDGLRERLESRENTLRKALQELAILRGERDPADYIAVRARLSHPRNPGGRPRTS